MAEYRTRLTGQLAFYAYITNLGLPHKPLAIGMKTLINPNILGEFIIFKRAKMGLHKLPLLQLSTAVCCSASVAVSSSAFAADTTVSSGQTVAGQVLNSGDTITIEAGGTILEAAGDAITINAGTATTTIVNNGSVGTLSDNGVFGPAARLALTNNGEIIGFISAINVQEITSINNAGLIGAFGPAVLAGMIDQFENSGRIESLFVNGVDAITINSFENSGTITGASDGVIANTISVFRNTGTISSILADGVDAITINSFENSGTISASGNGVDVTNIPNFLNSGVISGGGDGVDSDGGNSRIVNTGTISSTGSQGIDIANGVIINSGTVTGGGTGIEVDRSVAGNTTIINSGFIGDSSGPGGVAIDFQGTGSDVLNLLPGSVLVGSVNWDGVGDTINLGAGLSAIVTLTTAPAVSRFSSPAGFMLANVAIQADLSLNTIFDDVLFDVTNSIGSSVDARIASAFAGAQSSASTHQPNLSSAPNVSETFGLAGEEVEGTARGAFWGTLWGAGSQQDGSSNFASTRHRAGGTVFGVDYRADNGGLFGVYGGGSLGTLETRVSNGHKIDSKSHYVGAYGQWMAHDMTLSANVLGGLMNFDSSRTVANTGVPGGMQNAVADFDGMFVAPQLTISSHQEYGHMALIPSVKLAYAGLFLDEYSETGSGMNVTMASRDIHVASAQLRFASLHHIDDRNGSVTTFSPYVALEGRTAFGDADSANLSVFGRDISANIGSNENSGRILTGFEFSRPLTDTMKVFGGAEASYSSSGTISGEARIGWSVAF